MSIIQMLFTIFTIKKMRTRKVLFIAIILSIALGTDAQRMYRSVVCQSIPNLTPVQKQKIDKLSFAHQKKMDRLREQFYMESNVTVASEIKRKMDTEMADHYQNISVLLTPEQKTWFDQNCYANTRNEPYYGRGFGRHGRGYWHGGQGYGRGPGRGRCMGRGYERY